MKDKIKKFLGLYKYYDKNTLIVYNILRILIIVVMIRQIFQGNIENALLCILSLILLLLPVLIERRFKVDLPVTLEITILLFIFASEILGEINNFYGTFKDFDTILHTLNGFLCASIGFSLVYLLNENIESFNLSPVFVVLVSFCFSMTVGVCWEFFEYGMDSFVGTDMQKDTFITDIKSVSLNKEGKNEVVRVPNIKSTTLEVDGNTNTTFDKYLDIGLLDTMEDLLVNFIGAVVYSIFGFLYIKNKDKYKIALSFLIKRKTSKA